MYTRCLFCSRDLGRNEALEAFPVGRRLAYDAAKGRLWVVCPACARWNLTPLEERWEAIEQGERLYRVTRLRASTDNVGLARLADGTDLVRIGAALRPEFAAWRYGRQMRRRQVRHVARTAAGLPVAVAVAAGGLAVPYFAIGTLSVGAGAVGTLATAFVFSQAYQAVGDRVDRFVSRALGLNGDRVVAWLPVEGQQRRLPVTFEHLADARLGQGPGGAVTVDVAHAFGRRAYVGGDAERVLSLLMPHVNQGGASRADVQRAVAAIEARRGPERYLHSLARTAQLTARRLVEPGARVPVGFGSAPATNLFALSAVQRLALEMALREDVERRAMDGELAALEQAWRDAEEIAAIADGLALPSAVERAWARLRGPRDTRPAG